MTQPEYHDTLLFMVPLKLSLKNFLSYGQTTQHINFEPYNLICLSGKNGHGKSALLDALTWALWGYARKANTGARADENLVRLGQTQMMVSLEFICNNATYRVRRELNIQGTKTQTALDFGIIDPETGAIRGLTDKTIRATQEKITATIGLDYESFINSVFLRQGYSNEFSKKSPKERKEILSSILGITQFELIKKKALDKSRLLTTQKDTLLPIHARLSAEITLKVQLLAALQQAEEHEKLDSEKLSLLTREHQALTLQLQQQNNNKVVLEQAQSAHAKLQTRVTTGLQELHTARAEFKKILSKKITRHKDARAVPEQLQQEQLEKELEQIQTHEVTRLHMQQKLMHKQQELQALTTQLEQAHTQKMHAHDLLMQQTNSRVQTQEKRSAELSQKIKNLEQEIIKKTGTHNPETVVNRYEKYREVYQEFVAQKNNLTLNVQDYGHSLNKLTQGNSAACPTCKTELSSDKKEQLCTSQTKDQAHSTHQLVRLQKLLPPLKQTIINMHALVEQLKEAEHLKKQLLEIAQEYSLSTHELEQEKLIQQRHTEQKIELQATQKTVVSADLSYQQLMHEHADLAEKLALVPETTPEKKAQITELLKQVKLHNELTPETIAPLLQQIKKMVHVTIAYLKTLKREKSELETKIAILKNSIFEHAQVEQRTSALQTELQTCTQQVHQTMRDIGSYKEQLARIELQEKEFLKLDLTIKESALEHELYHTIAQAVGKDGIQALLIEQALPEIEREANTLLEKLTDNQAHLFIESVRDLKSGKSKETLDIHISDASGIRAYELFSGGEAFRIDFALRIALSKLLARRAGTALQTLIIDEGFGSQDEEGLAHIMEALYKIQDDFAKIIIVSHLPYMKDQFPVHFVVSKSAQGSAVKVIEQG